MITSDYGVQRSGVQKGGLFLLLLLPFFLFFFSKRFSVYSLLSCKTYSGLLLLFEHGPASDGQSSGLDEG